MPRSLRPALAVLLGLATAWTLTGCGTAAARPSPAVRETPIVAAAVPAEGAAGLYIAQQDGLFAKAGLHVTIVPTENPTLNIPDLIHGSEQLLSGQYTTYIGADAHGLAKFRIIAAGYNLGPGVQEIMTGPRSPITKAAQLKGATIAVNATNSITTDLLYTALAPYGITPSDVHVVPVPFPAMGAALAQHRVDAAYEVEPYVTEFGQKDGDVSVLDIDAGAAQGFPINGYGVLASYAAQHPRIVAALAHAIEQGNAIAATDSAARERALEIALHLPAHVAAVEAAGTFPTALDRVGIQRAADLMLRYGQLSRRFDVAGITG
jgi:NitT/TauT family transport system substrate-binding protein